MWVTEEFKKYIENCQHLSFDNISITDFNDIIYSVGRGICKETKLPISKSLLRVLLHFSLENKSDYYIIENYKNIISIQDNTENEDLDYKCISRVIMPLFHKNKLCGSIIFSSYNAEKIFSYLDMEGIMAIKKVTEKFIKKFTADEI